MKKFQLLKGLEIIAETAGVVLIIGLTADYFFQMYV